MDYQQQEGQATSWRRAAQVIVNNTRDRTPSIIFHEEDRVSVNGVEFAVPGMPKSVGAPFNPEGLIPLLNPITGEPLGTSVTQQEFYVILFSLYMQLAVARDNAPPVEPPSIPPAQPQEP
jgi:hypothetical protein